MGKLIYLTGSPGSGKSSVLNEIKKEFKFNVQIWGYGERLKSKLEERDGTLLSTNELRAESSNIVTPQDIIDLDNDMLDWVNDNRSNNVLFIDSHPITKEVYGYRATTFDVKMLSKLRIDEIWEVYCRPEVAYERIKLSPQGRTHLSVYDCEMHNNLQNIVAVNYAIQSSAPAYFFDNSGSLETTVSFCLKRLNKICNS